MARDEIVFLDTSIIIAALLSHTGGSARVISESQATHRLAINDHVLDELVDVLPRKFGDRPGLEIELYVLLSLNNIEIFQTASMKSFRRLYEVINKGDAPILASALENSARFLISLDKDFLNDKTKRYAAIQDLIICTPGDFINKTLKSH